MTCIDKVRNFIEEHQLFETGSPIVVGVSGGPDSVALLSILHKLNYNCVSAHCNFHLRGEESDRDMVFVQQLTSALNIPLLVTHFKTEEYAETNHISIEMAARELRYGWFEKIRVEYASKAIAIAHHSDDVIETFFINLMRGSGLQGLTGIKPRNGYIIRPLLCLSRQDIMSFIKEEGLEYVVDSTNNENDYVRNKIRNIVIPNLTDINVSAKKNILKSISNLRQSELLQKDVIGSWNENTVTDGPDKTVINLNSVFSSPHKSIILFELLRPYQGSAEIVKEILKSNIEDSGLKFFTNDYVYVKNRNLLEIKRKDSIEEISMVVPEFSESLIIERPLHMVFETHAVNEVSIKKCKTDCYVDLDKVLFPLKIRQWKHGDIFCPFGQNKRKKVSDFFVDEKLSILEKESTLILTTADDQIVWIIGKRPDNRFRITEKTHNLLHISI